ncbi:MAG TPA: MmcQ/YjbR family DNA-binding protein [Solirubrobacteraceae bacterium]|nr:MmcQ/YjbR family DNA-binding protein [Solirubrobacteraceae bacterium]
MITTARVRELALALPEAVEQDHHGMPSFRVAGKIFATLPDERHVRVMAAEGDILAAVAEDPTACSEFWWGSRLACVVVRLAVADPRLVAELLTDAWARRAPRRLLRTP